MNQTIRCEHCESTFSVEYDEEVIEDSPLYCLFCGGYIADAKDHEPLNLDRFNDNDELEL